MADKFTVRPFGNDCLGNITGYVVERYVWVPRPWSGRSDGLCQEREIADQFVGNIYEPGSFDTARAAADALCAKLNG
jgi:hypothetical protein